MDMSQTHIPSGHRCQINVYSTLVQRHLMEMTWKQQIQPVCPGGSYMYNIGEETLVVLVPNDYVMMLVNIGLYQADATFSAMVAQLAL